MGLVLNVGFVAGQEPPLAALAGQGVVDEIEMSDVAADVAAVAAFVAADTTDVMAADTTEVFSTAKAADGGACPAIGHRSIVGQRSIVRPTFNSMANIQ